MVRIYESNEIPPIYIDAIKKFKINLNKIEYVAIPEVNHFSCLKMLIKLSKDFVALTTDTNETFYCLNKSAK